MLQRLLPLAARSERIGTLLTPSVVESMGARFAAAAREWVGVSAPARLTEFAVTQNRMLTEAGLPSVRYAIADYGASSTQLACYGDRLQRFSTKVLDSPRTLAGSGVHESTHLEQHFLASSFYMDFVGAKQSMSPTWFNFVRKELDRVGMPTSEKTLKQFFSLRAGRPLTEEARERAEFVLGSSSALKDRPSINVLQSRHRFVTFMIDNVQQPGGTRVAVKNMLTRPDFGGTTLDRPRARLAPLADKLDQRWDPEMTRKVQEQLVEDLTKTQRQLRRQIRTERNIYFDAYHEREAYRNQHIATDAFDRALKP